MTNPASKDEDQLAANVSTADDDSEAALEKLFPGVPTSDAASEDLRITVGKLADRVVQLEISMESNVLSTSDHEFSIKKLALTEREQDLQQRHELTGNLFRLICVWMGFIAVVLVVCGCHWMKLADNVLITLLTTTTATVLGLFTIVARYFFKNSGDTK